MPLAEQIPQYYYAPGGKNFSMYHYAPGGKKKFNIPLCPWRHRPIDMRPLWGRKNTAPELCVHCVKTPNARNTAKHCA